MIFFNFTTDLDLDFHIYKDGDNWYSSISIMCQKLATLRKIHWYMCHGSTMWPKHSHLRVTFVKCE